MSAAWAIQNQFQLSLKNGLLNAAFEASTEMIIAINEQGIITQTNAMAQKLFSQINEKIIGVKIDDIFGVLPFIQSVLNTGRSMYDLDIEIECANQKMVLCSILPILDDGGPISGCVINLRNNTRYKRGIKSGISDVTHTFDSIIGDSPPIVMTKEKAGRFARLDNNILIQGESGTGKELFAQAVHNASCIDGPFVAVNCAAIPRSLIESELFGYEGGAFTGAERKGRIGKIEMANGGTLFLDEIGDMPMEIQPVLLRVLEDKKVMRVGGNRYIPVNFRLVTATNKNLYDMVKSKIFREDLYYRLSVLKISIPPLRDRGLDIIKLIHFFIDKEAKKQKMTSPLLSEELKFKLLQYSWPGNVRQLQNAVVYAINTSADGIIKFEDIPEEIINELSNTIPENKCLIENPINADSITEGIVLKDVEAVAILQALHKTGGNVLKAAKALGLSKSTMYRRLKKIKLPM